MTTLDQIPVSSQMRHLAKLLNVPESDVYIEHTGPGIVFGFYVAPYNSSPTKYVDFKFTAEQYYNSNHK